MTQPTNETVAQPMTYGEAVAKMSHMASIIRALEKAYGEAMDEFADAEALYRRSLAEAYREFRESGKTVDESNTYARGKVFNLSRERDRAMGKSRRVVEELEDRRGERVSLHRLVEWSTALALINKGAIPDREDNGAGAYDYPG